MGDLDPITCYTRNFSRSCFTVKNNRGCPFFHRLVRRYFAAFQAFVHGKMQHRPYRMMDEVFFKKAKGSSRSGAGSNLSS